MEGRVNAIMTRLQDTLTDEEKNEISKTQRKIRFERYACQSVAKKALPNERIAICLRNVVGSQVEVLKHLKTQKAFYGGLMICGSVWTCPVCASKISERRKKELHRAFTTHKKNGGHLAMLTLTFSHKKTDKLSETLKSFSDATTKFSAGKAYNEIRKEMGIIGRVKVLEVTHGVNGFHPHAHIALFYENDIDLDLITARMYRLWQKACEKVGLSTAKKYGLDLQGGDQAEAYLAKHGNWSMEQELSKAHIKKGKKGSLTPFDFLREYLLNDDESYLKLFREYAVAFKGKRQIHWSRGLKTRFDISDKTDEEIAKEKVEQADQLGMLHIEEWRYILGADKRAQLLDNIELHGFDKGLAITLNSKN